MARGYFLNGQRQAGGAECLAVRSPFDGTVVGEVAQAGPEVIEAAISGMVAAREAMGRMPSYRRAEACDHVQRRLAERSEEFARTIARDVVRHDALSNAIVHHGRRLWRQASRVSTESW